MIRFTALLAALPHDKTALPRYLQTASETDRTTCLALLSGQRPKRIATPDTLAHWAAEAAGIPDWLLAAAVTASGDRSEAAALILPPPTGTPPRLSEVLLALTTTTPITAHATLLALWSRLPQDANLILNRLATGSFRTKLPAENPAPSLTPYRILAVMILVQPAVPEITLALWLNARPIPITRLPLTLPETADILLWTRSHTTDRFGPIRQVTPDLVFEIAFDGIFPNRRRKSGFELQNPRLIALHRDAKAAPLADLLRLLPQP